MEIKNRKQVIEQLTSLLYEIDCECRKCDTQIYLSIDDNGNGKLETYNTVGNNWLVGDNLFYVDTVNADSDDCVDYMCSEGVGDLCEILDIDYDDLIRKVRNYYDFSEDDKIEFIQCAQFVRDNNKYLEIVQDAYVDWLKDFMYEYRMKAETMIDDLEKEEM